MFGELKIDVVNTLSQLNRAIFAYKIFPGWPKPDESDPTFWELANLVVTQANKFYNTTLVCDEPTAEYFKDKLPFTNIEISKGITEYKGGSYGIPKVLAMIEQTEPYISLDLDSVLLKPIKDYNDITFGFAEVNFNHPEGVTEGMMDTACRIYFNKDELDKIKPNLPTDLVLKWEKIPNGSLVYVPNPEIISKIYSQILDDHQDIIEQVSPMMIEQFLLIQYLNHYDYNTNWIQLDYGIEEMSINQNYYLHWGKNDTEKNILLKLLRDRYMKTPLL